MNNTARFTLPSQHLIYDNVAVPSTLSSMYIMCEFLKKVAEQPHSADRARMVDLYVDQLSRQKNPVSVSWHDDDRIRIWNTFTQTYLDTGVISRPFAMLLLPRGYYDTYWRLCRMMELDQYIAEHMPVFKLEKQLTDEEGQWRYTPDRIACALYVWEQIEHKCITDAIAQGRDYHYDKDMHLSLMPKELLDASVSDEDAFLAAAPYLPQDQPAPAAAEDEPEHGFAECPRLTEALFWASITDAHFPCTVRVTYAVLDDGQEKYGTTDIYADCVEGLHNMFWEFCQEIGQDSFICKSAQILYEDGSLFPPSPITPDDDTRLWAALSQAGITAADMPHLVRLTFLVHGLEHETEFMADTICGLRDRFETYCLRERIQDPICTRAVLVDTRGTVMEPYSKRAHGAKKVPS